MKTPKTLSLMIFIAFIAIFNCNLIAQNNIVTAAYTSMTHPNTTGGKWIWGNNISIGDTVSLELKGEINHYDVPWCTSFECCKNPNYNGMSISVHTIIPDSSYRIFITGGLSGGVYFSDGFIEIPLNWKIDSITGLPQSPSYDAFFNLNNNRVDFHSGINYSGCVCSDCGRANVNYYITKTKVQTSEITKRINSMLIYPNPAKEQITVENRLKDQSQVQISVYDIHNLLLIQEISNNSSTNIDISKLAKGVYIVKLAGNNRNDIAKIIKK